MAGVTELSPLYRQLQYICNRPGMYVGSYRVQDLRLYLEGWRAHRNTTECNDPFAEVFFAEFNDFVAKRYSEEKSIGWAEIIAEAVSGEGAQLDLFFELVEDFRSTALRS